jgi:hypothetical protein
MKCLALQSFSGEYICAKGCIIEMPEDVAISHQKHGLVKILDQDYVPPVAYETAEDVMVDKEEKIIKPVTKKQKAQTFPASMKKNRFERYLKQR